MARLLALLNGLSSLVMVLMVICTIDPVSLSQASGLVRRQDPNAPPPATQDQQEAVVALASTDPVAAAQMAIGLPYISGPNSVATGSLTSYTLVHGDDVQQLPWNNGTPLTTVPAVNGSDTGGWQTLPQLDGFNLNRTFKVRGDAVMPFYISANYDPSQIKRAVIVMPGKPRDCWKYTALVRSALNIVAQQGQPGANNASVLLMGMCWLNQNDKAAGAVQPNELYWRSSGWASGSHSQGPPVPLTDEEYQAKLHKLNRTLQQHADQAEPGEQELQRRQQPPSPSDPGAAAAPPKGVQNLTLPPDENKTNISSYEVMDTFLDWLFDKSVFPSINRVVVAGHSMGAQAVQRYAMLKKTKAYDPNVFFWIGNPGSYVFPTDDRENANATCQGADSWPYGMSNVTKVPPYARRDVNASLSAIIKRYRSRDVHYAYGLLDNGQGDTHCQATMQGWNHLDRGCHFVLALANTSDSGEYKTGPNLGFPTAKQTVDFVANTSHQDYPMLSTNVTLWRLFNDRFDTADAELTNLTNPGDRQPHVHAPKNGTRGGRHGEEHQDKRFATHFHLLIAEGLLYGSLGGILVIYTALYCLCSVGRDDQAWRRDLDAATTARGAGTEMAMSTLVDARGAASMAGLRKRRGPSDGAGGGIGGGHGRGDSSFSRSPGGADDETDQMMDTSSIASNSPFLAQRRTLPSPQQQQQQQRGKAGGGGDVGGGYDMDTATTGTTLVGSSHHHHHRYERGYESNKTSASSDFLLLQGHGPGSPAPQTSALASLYTTRAPSPL
ncbi:uncharacterized protein PFL1_01885 [Pseudozyma flocculosa PF-1]|uniref:uncharacterized protein n=1 Tax=Pseudozyma flocculosa PF-1 TaxID=1277687 RepID=UPI00045608AC|nr:uncharacterized protein PFL1_01885 [Pseudozyma flocculosa PF-1]EPQ30359.1 hypothetical protein PFL1_01885 [Pseudozyma flocculosa PF-1]